MNILFLTIIKISDLNERGIYTDLMRKFRDEGHNVYIVSSNERRYHQATSIKKEQGIVTLKVRTFNIQKTNSLEKVIGIMTIGFQFLAAIKKFLSDIKFDLILYSTPPITFSTVISYVKRDSGSKSYLLLKDIFPQNAVDLGVMLKGGLFFNLFRMVEKKLYTLSDIIGCMSPANVKFILSKNKGIDPRKVELCPNSIEPLDNFIVYEEKIRNTSSIYRFYLWWQFGKTSRLEFSFKGN